MNVSFSVKSILMKAKESYKNKGNNHSRLKLKMLISMQEVMVLIMVIQERRKIENKHHQVGIAESQIKCMMLFRIGIRLMMNLILLAKSQNEKRNFNKSKRRD